MKDKFILCRRDKKELLYGRDDVWIKELIRIDAETALAPIDDASIERINNDFYNNLVVMSKKLGRRKFQSREWHNCIKRALYEYPEVADVFLYATKEVNAGMGKYVSR